MCRRGRPSKDSGKGGHTTTAGDFIEGLRRRANNRFYPVGVSSVSFGSDEAIAVMRFRQWQQANGVIRQPVGQANAQSNPQDKQRQIDDHSAHILALQRF